MAFPAKWIGSPNRTTGRGGYRPEAVVVHIMEGTLAGTDSWFKSPTSKVSAHYGIGKDGTVHQYVNENDQAWHAGRVYNSTWSLRKDGVNPNRYTIGIEHEGQGDDDWTDEMYETSAALIRDVCNRWSIPMDRDHIVGHREIYARKTCPGSKVDLNKLIAMAKEEAVSDAVYNFVPDVGTVVARSNLNVRRSPNTEQDRVRLVSAGETLKHVGWTSNGLSVHGNAHWYKDEDGNYFWAGATDTPIPGLPPR